MAGKCPKCEKPILRLDMSAVESRVPFGAMAWKTVTFNCPLCHTVVGAQIDPIAVKTDIIRELKRALGRD